MQVQLTDEILRKVQKATRYTGGEWNSIYKNREDVKAKFLACNWNVIEVDGHDAMELAKALDVAIERAEKIGRRQIKLKTENGLEIINASNIMCSEAYEHYQYISLNDETQMKVRSTVTELFTILNKHGGFLRVGSSYIINLRYVKNVSRTDVLLYNNKKIQRETLLQPSSFACRNI